MYNVQHSVSPVAPHSARPAQHWYHACRVRQQQPRRVAFSKTIRENKDKTIKMWVVYKTRCYNNNVK